MKIEDLYFEAYHDKVNKEHLIKLLHDNEINTVADLINESDYDCSNLRCQDEDCLHQGEYYKNFAYEYGYDEKKGFYKIDDMSDENLIEDFTIYICPECYASSYIVNIP